ncbi:MAG: RluA family pseudouridine synthase [Planctomycetia bacterium]|nr:RluA family pseudouridine synthase [Planctomycetia bacterium]
MYPPLEILFEDNHCLAVVKPAPLLTQAPPEIPSLEALVRAYLKERYQKPGYVYLGIPHRLDRPVSGVVLFARQTKAAQRLHEQFQQRQVTKVYWAAVEGDVQPEAGVWEDWLLKVQEASRSERAAPDAPGAKHAVLHYRRLAGDGNRTLLELQPQTGRMHQLRVQTALRGWPVLGDTHYGATQPFGPAAELSRDRIIALHARQLTFLHPIRYEPITVTAPLPAVWDDLPFVISFSREPEVSAGQEGAPPARGEKTRKTIRINTGRHNIGGQLVRGGAGRGGG